MSRLTRDGRPNLPREAKIPGTNRDREMLIFPRQDDLEQDWHPHQVDPYRVVLS